MAMMWQTVNYVYQRGPLDPKAKENSGDLGKFYDVGQMKGIDIHYVPFE